MSCLSDRNGELHLETDPKYRLNFNANLNVIKIVELGLRMIIVIAVFLMFEVVHNVYLL